MMIRVPFIDRIKVLSRDFIDGKSFALNRSRSYQAEILLLSSRRGGEQSPCSAYVRSSPGRQLQQRWYPPEPVDSGW